MIHEGIEFYNTLELDAVAGGGLALRRFPRDLRNCLSPLGQMVSPESAGCELRFVTEASSFRLSLSCQPSNILRYEPHTTDVFIFKGAFLHSIHHLEPGCCNHIDVVDIDGKEASSFLKLNVDVRDNEYFNHQVWRVMFGRYVGVFYGLDTYGDAVRPPEPNEVPRRKILLYGSSITQGANPSRYYLCYAQQLARILKVDAINCGFSGSCLCEPEMADFIVKRDDWNLITMEIGVNMRDKFTPTDFEQRSRSLVSKVIARHPDKPVFLITCFPNAESQGIATEASFMQERQLSYDAILRGFIEEFGHPNLHLIEGREVLNDYSGIGSDLIHPSDYGHIEMAQNLARIIKTNMNE